jgi:hypothetical protein
LSQVVLLWQANLFGREQCHRALICVRWVFWVETSWPEFVMAHDNNLSRPHQRLANQGDESEKPDDGCE